jgi:hypothetical protein
MRIGGWSSHRLPQSGFAVHTCTFRARRLAAPAGACDNP